MGAAVGSTQASKRAPQRGRRLFFLCTMFRDLNVSLARLADEHSHSYAWRQRAWVAPADAGFGSKLARISTLGSDPPTRASQNSGILRMNRKIVKPDVQPCRLVRLRRRFQGAISKVLRRASVAPTDRFSASLKLAEVASTSASSGGAELAAVFSTSRSSGQRIM